MNILMVQPLFIGTTELILIGGVALLLFGGKKLPEMMRGLGQGVKEFKKGMSEVAPVDGEEPAKENVEASEVPQGETKGSENKTTTNGE